MNRLLNKQKVVSITFDFHFRFFETLQTDLARVGNVSRLSESDPTDKISLTTPDDVSSNNDKQRCLVWMTSQTYSGLPSMLTQYLYKISWDTLLRLVVQV